MQARDGRDCLKLVEALRAIGPEPWNAAFVQPSRRPTDGRYGDNPNRLQRFYQFQVIMKPSPLEIQDLYIGSLKAMGFDPLEHDIRFVEDNWESPTLGAWGLGWEVWLNGMSASRENTACRYATDPDLLLHHPAPCESRD